MKQADIGLIGLAVMGSNLALNIAENGYRVAVNNRTASKIDDFVSNAGELAEWIIPNADPGAVVSSIKSPRSIILMVKAGKPVDMTIAALLPHLDKGDVIIDAGNANYRDSVRRYEELTPQGIGFLGIGVSGGEEGARHGPSIMVGGSKPQWLNAEEILTAISAKFNGEPCCAYLGESGAGHFVKTIHNGIEYADMQMIAEVYGIMRDGLGMDPKACAQVFRGWNKGPLNSYLIEITGHVLEAVDEKTGAPLIDLILDKAGQKGTGRWSAIAGLELGVPATTIEGAVAARSVSALRDERIAAEKIFGALLDGEVEIEIETLEKALLAGKIAAYAQGFAVMSKASEENNWDLPLGTIARIWRAGCIIRSGFLDQMASSYDKGVAANLMVAPDFAEIMKANHGALRQVVAAGALGGLPMVSLGSALSYFDSYRKGRGTANLIQGQRDFFGAHGFILMDREGEQHGDWPSTLD
ncbi:MAG: NADP-dependent phosphogluconate dehydrogenase [Devosiaceae bacterium]|nr:NADP-dependent phosphogluconate dehydrogenase [Devosiaceae bacterium]